jgi:hypothetical protein
MAKKVINEVVSEATPTMIAREALAAAGGDVAGAADIMVERVMSDARLYKILMDPLVKAACRDVIAAQRGRPRRHIWKSADAFGQRVKALMQVVASDFSLPGGKKPGDRPAAISQKPAEAPKKKVRRAR